MKTIILVAQVEATEEEINQAKAWLEEKTSYLNFVVVDGVPQLQNSQESRESHPITGEILDAVASATGKTPLELATMASEMGINTVEDALNSNDVPEEIKSVLRELI